MKMMVVVSMMMTIIILIIFQFKLEKPKQKEGKKDVYPKNKKKQNPMLLKTCTLWQNNIWCFQRLSLFSSLLFRSWNLFILLPVIHSVRWLLADFLYRQDCSFVLQAGLQKNSTCAVLIANKRWWGTKLAKYSWLSSSCQCEKSKTYSREKVIEENRRKKSLVGENVIEIAKQITNTGRLKNSTAFICNVKKKTLCISGVNNRNHWFQNTAPQLTKLQMTKLY